MEKRPELSKPFILSYLTEEQIFCKYLEIDEVDFERKYINCLRNDDNPNCRFFISNKTNTLKFNDFAWRIFDCWDVVQFKTNAKNFHEILENIAIDFNLIKGNPSKINKVIRPHKPKNYNIKIKRKEFTKQELTFWTPNESWNNVINAKVLQDYKIYSISAFWEFVQDNEFSYVNLKMHFAYQWEGYVYQLYIPFSKTRRFICSPNLKYGDLEFLDLFCNYVLITKAKKCSTFLRLSGVNSCFIINEIVKPDEILHFIYTKYFGEDIKIFTLFDNDWTGLKASVKFRQKGCIPLLIPEFIGKDFTDYAIYEDYEVLTTEIKQLKEKWNLK